MIQRQRRKMLARRLATSCRRIWLRGCLAHHKRFLSGLGPLPGPKPACTVQASKPEYVRVKHVSRIVQTQHGEVEVMVPKVCFGCGVKLQDKDPDKPGYYDLTERLLTKILEDEQERREMGRPDPESSSDEGGEEEEISNYKKSSDEEKKKVLDEVREPVQYVVEDDDDMLALRCARCHSLVNYGKVKSALGESFLPEFDLGRKVGRKIALQKGRRAVVLCVVDITDFDGSLPRTALRELIPTSAAVPGMACKLILAVNKVDLLPKSVAKTRLEIWVRTRAKDARCPPLAAVHLVSSVNMMGIQALLQDAITRVGMRGDLWVVGAQNAGKSSLINALKQATGTSGRKDVTAAWLPGTTVDVVEVKGLPMPLKCSVFDTPGVRHDFQLTSIVNPAECLMLLPKQRLAPRTFRTASRYSILVGGLARLDILSCPTASLYLTFWGADQVQLHLGKTERAEEQLEKFSGASLFPPENPQRFKDLGPLIPMHVEVKGSSWKMSTKDLCIAGLGWFGIGVVGVAKFCVYTLEGAQVTVRDSLVPDFASDFETPGFSRTVNARAPMKKKVRRRKKK